MKEKILEILSEIRPECDFTKSVDYIKEGMLDSLDIVSLVDSLEEEFSISIPGTDISFKNFGSIEAIIDMVEKYKLD